MIMVVIMIIIIIMPLPYTTKKTNKYACELPKQESYVIEQTKQANRQ